MIILGEHPQTSFEVLFIFPTRTWSTSLLSTNCQMYEVNASRFPEAYSSCDFWWCLCVEFWIWVLVHREVSFPIVWERVHFLLYFLDYHVSLCNELLKNLSYATRNCLLHEFSSRPSHSECCPCGNSSVDQLRTLWRNWVEVSHLQIWSRFCMDCAKCRSSYSLQIFRNATSDPFETQVVLRTIIVSTFIDNFYDAFFQHRLVRNDGVDAVCQNSFLCRGQVNSALYILFRSSMNMIIHLYSVSWYL